MGYRRKSKDAALVEAIAGLAGFGVLLWMISPQFRLIIQVILLIFITLVLIALAIWLAYKIFRPTRALSSFGTTETKREVHRANQVTISRPPTIGEELKYAPPAPEPTLAEQLRKIDWFQFEKLMELIYQHQGFSVKRFGGANPDGGIDLIIESPTEKFAVQCKQWKTWQVGVQPIREFLGALTDRKIEKGIFVTLKGYSRDAEQLADKHGIQILAEPDLIKMIEASGLIYSREISSLLSDSRKFCPKCENELVLRNPKRDGRPFWGCSTFPRCRFIMKFDGEPSGFTQSSRRFSQFKHRSRNLR
jgi:hypothetical protein